MPLKSFPPLLLCLIADMKKASRFIFTDAQLKQIHSFFPEFAVQVEEHDPKYAGRNPKVTAWKQQKAAVLIDEPLFVDLDPAETQQKWQEVRPNLLISLSFHY